MTNEELLAKIKDEIERLEKENCINSGEHFCMRRALCLGRLRQIISENQREQMESEKPMQEGLDEEINRTYHDGSVTDTSDLDHNSYENIARHFAKWGADNTPLPEDTVLFNKGVEEGKRLAEEEQADLFTIVALDAAQRAKEQMLKEAVEAEYGYFSNASKTILPSGKLNIKEGDKVRIIILPKED